jgi:type I restriction enzyme S subunit
VKAGWGASRLVQLCNFFSDGDWIESKDQSPSGVRLIQTGNVGNGKFKNRSEKARYISSATFDSLRCTELRAGDCLVSRLPDPVGRSCLIPELTQRAITAVDCTIIRFLESKLIPAFFVYFTQSLEYAEQVARLTGGATRQRISRKNLGQIIIPLPPLEEQRRIVAVLDEAFAAIDTATANAEKNLQRARALFESHLQKVFNQRGEEWGERSLSEVCTLVNGRAYKKEEMLGSGKYPLLRVGNFFTNKDWFYSDLELEPDKYCDTGDLLYAWSASFGPRIWEGKKVIYHYHIWKVLPNPVVVEKRFLLHLLSWDVDKIKRAHGTGATMMHVSKGSMEARAVPIPPLECQSGIVAQLDSLQEESQLLESLYRKKVALLGALKESLLHQAFSAAL